MPNPKIHIIYFVFKIILVMPVSLFTFNKKRIVYDQYYRNTIPNGNGECSNHTNN